MMLKEMIEMPVIVDGEKKVIKINQVAFDNGVGQSVEVNKTDGGFQITGRAHSIINMTSTELIEFAEKLLEMAQQETLNRGPEILTKFIRG